MTDETRAQVVIINGSAFAGKDTFCELCQQFANCHVFSSVDRVKDAARILGWDGIKTERARRFLSDLKDLATSFGDLPMKSMRRAVSEIENRAEIIFLMIREPEEIERAKHAFDALTLLVRRQGVEQVTSNRADCDVNNYDYDYTVYNHGTLEDLGKLAAGFVQKVRTGYFYAECV